tara:strand:+ start:1608 stop:2663 length:1056 start_codon:yes stop_codon:yes gene_type:complete
MSDPYTPPTIVDYNASPPADDGTEVESNKIKWSFIKEKLVDPVKNLVDAINTAVDGAFDTVKTLFNSTSAKTGAYTVLSTENGVLFLGNATSGAFTFTLLAAATAGDGFRVSFKKTDASANALTIDGNASETIDGATTVTIDNRYDEITVVCDGSNWHTVADHFASPLGLADGGTAAITAAAALTSLTIGNHDSITVDANGHQTNTEQMALLVHSGSTQTSATGDATTATVVQGTEIFDQNDDHDGTSTITFPVAGRYFIEASVSTEDATTSHTQGLLTIITSNRSYSTQLHFGNLVEQNSGGERLKIGMAVIADADASDTCTVTLQVNASTKIVDIMTGIDTRLGCCLLT